MNSKLYTRIRLKKIKEYITRIFSKTWSACLVTIILMAIIMFWRKPSAFLNPQFWAEDGVIFFKQNFDLGLKTLTMPHSGYLHTIPRIAAIFASWFPVSLAPTIYNLSSLGLMFLVACSLYSSRCFITWKPIFALSIVLVPHFGEVFMTITNAQWYGCLLMVILLCKEPPSKYYHYIFDYLTIIICGLSGPFLIFLFPLFLVRFIIKRTPYNCGILITSLICVLIQGWFILDHGGEGGEYSYDFNSFVNILGVRIIGRLFLMKDTYEDASPIILAIFAIILPVVLIFFTETKRQRYLVLTFSYFYLSVVVGTLYKFKGFPGIIAFSVTNGERYFYVPHIMLMWSLAVYLDSKITIKRQIVSVLLIMTLISSSQYFRAFEYVDLHWKRYSDRIESGVFVRVPVNPVDWSIPFGNPESVPKIDSQDTNDVNIETNNNL